MRNIPEMCQQYGTIALQIIPKHILLIHCMNDILLAHSQKENYKKSPQLLRNLSAPNLDIAPEKIR